MKLPIVLILAGGSGSRLWPLSTKTHPKQFLNLENDLSLLQNTARRFLDLFSFEQLFIVTSNDLYDLTSSHLNQICPALCSQIIIEPFSKNTAFAITWAVGYLNKKFENIDYTLLVSPIDHVFFPEDRFKSQILHALNLFDPNHILAFGIKPKKIDPQMGYLKKGSNLKEKIFHCDGFTEKPSYEEAKMLISNNQLANIGLYLMKKSVFENELKLHLPSYVHLLKNPSKIDQTHLPHLSIDHGLMQKSRNIYLYEFQGITWSDLGSWSNLSDFLSKLTCKIKSS